MPSTLFCFPSPLSPANHLGATKAIGGGERGAGGVRASERRPLYALPRSTSASTTAPKTMRYQPKAARPRRLR